MPALTAVRASSELGPLFSSQDRDKYAPELNETCALTDRVFQDKTSIPVRVVKPGDPEYATCHPIRKKTDHKHANPKLVQVKPTATFVIGEYEKMIEEHVERRILFAFQQLIVAHQTKLHFENPGAQDQGASPDRIAYGTGTRKTKLVTRNAAHSSTLPCLVAYDKRAWDAHQAGTGNQPDGFVFLKGTDYYRTANATMNMPCWINNADSKIDGTGTKSGLRIKALRLVNRSSQGELTPDEAIRLFVQDGLDEIRSTRRNLQALRKFPEVQQVLAKYEAYFVRFQQDIQTNPKFLENFLNITIDPNSHDERAKRVILKLRYAAIRNVQVDQAKLMQRIEGVRKLILAEIKGANLAAGGTDNQPDYFNGAFRTLLVSQARTVQDRQRLEILLNFSKFDFAAKMGAKTQGPQTKFANITNTLSAQNHVTRIKRVARKTFHDMRTLRTEEAQQRAATIKTLRAMKGWQQWRLGNEVAARFPFAAASQSTICRIETLKKLVTPPIAKEFSTVFNVDPGLFMPHFFYD